MFKNISDSVKVKPLHERRYPPVADSSEITISSKPADYSASRIAAAIEDCDAHLLNLNLTDERTESGDLVIDLRVNRRNADGVIRSLSRYGYDVLDVASDESGIDEADRLRAMEILRMLEI